MNFGYTDVNRIFARIAQDLNIQQEMRSNAIIVWAFEALHLIGETHQYEEKIQELQVHNFEADVPCDFYMVKQVLYGSTFLTGSTNTVHNTLPQHRYKGVPLRANTLSTGVYNIINNRLITSFKEGKVVLYYYAQKMDEYGNLLIPDIVEYENAIVSYIVMKIKYAEAVSGKITLNDYEFFNQKWLSARKIAMSTIAFPDPDRVAAMGKANHRFIADFNNVSNGYRNSSYLEHIKEP